MPLDFSALRVAVVGDLILDRYLEGSVARLSPEAPVAILTRERERDVLGGVANVAANVAALGAEVALVGVIGADEPGRRLSALVEAHPGLDTSLLVVDPTRPTTTKTRAMSGLYQLLRIDSEFTGFVAPDVEAELIHAICRATAWADVVVLSDYAKGVCSDRVIRTLIEAAAHLGKGSLIDPKRADFSVYRGATLIKPNRRELSAASGIVCAGAAEIAAAAAAMIELTGAEILVTRSEDGISHYSRDIGAIHVPTGVRDVFDVSGAGDTVAAVVALGMAGRLTMVETMRLANLAAGIVVGKVGTAVATLAELDAAIREDGAGAGRGPTEETGALVSLEAAVHQRREWGRLGLRVGFTNGCFDLVHPGHVALLSMAAAACDRLIVAINTDASVRRLKGTGRPVQGETARATVLGALRAVDCVVLFDEDTPAHTIAALEPDVLVKGADYQEHQVVGGDRVRAAGGEVMLVPLVSGQSTTAMIARRDPRTMTRAAG